MSDLKSLIEWPLESKPVPQADLPYFNLHYLYGCKTPSDPTIVWGTEIDVTGMQAFLREQNKTSRILLSPAHLLLQAVGRNLAKFPRLNSRVVGNRIYRFRETNVRTMIYNKELGEVDVVMLRNAPQLSLERIARLMWKYQRQAVKRDTQDHTDRRIQKQWWPRPLLALAVKTYFWLDSRFKLPKMRFDRLSSAPVLVNFLGFSGAPSMTMYKPSSYPDESSNLSVTMGRIEKKPVVRGGEVVVRPMAPLFIRIDHRLADAFVLAQFLSAISDSLNDPAVMESQEIKGNDPENPALQAA
ncbi:2-oxo acid dehydrogenase subunit E2 [Lignipirellula cremea]|uniref:Branched-chain alpha-keto acid dehydrogenase subunit E2 n=1 Tax=Lignipirellula cremea TaxID=2528010 RepID=A0A518E3J7_9BACT|nr:2-oxo acid dehydrogenase subunit E2 [Lignipirellula cremea]QDU98652.1 branched-chain alpha-keto acid dehydrogenase subunit E2 [Lignipirellula cremea]